MDHGADQSSMSFEQSSIELEGLRMWLNQQSCDAGQMGLEPDYKGDFDLMINRFLDVCAAQLSKADELTRRETALAEGEYAASEAVTSAASAQVQATLQHELQNVREKEEELRKEQEELRKEQEELREGQEELRKGQEEHEKLMAQLQQQKAIIEAKESTFNSGLARILGLIGQDQDMDPNPSQLLGAISNLELKRHNNLTPGDRAQKKSRLITTPALSSSDGTGSSQQQQTGSQSVLFGLSQHESSHSDSTSDRSEVRGSFLVSQAPPAFGNTQTQNPRGFQMPLRPQLPTLGSDVFGGVSAASPSRRTTRQGSVVSNSSADTDSITAAPSAPQRRGTGKSQRPRKVPSRTASQKDDPVHGPKARPPRQDLVLSENITYEHVLEQIDILKTNGTRSPAISLAHELRSAFEEKLKVFRTEQGFAYLTRTTQEPRCSLRRELHAPDTMSQDAISSCTWCTHYKQLCLLKVKNQKPVILPLSQERRVDVDWSSPLYWFEEA